MTHQVMTALQSSVAIMERDTLKKDSVGPVKPTDTANLELTKRFGFVATLPDRKKQAIKPVGRAYSDASNDLELGRPRLSRS